MSSFPDGFVFGVSTASYQIEGAAREGGRGPSIWDAFSRAKGRVDRGETGDRACDHYHRYGDDVRLMGEAGLDAYRFSIAWPRVQPDGKGRWNQAGLDFYDRLVDALLAAGIEAWPCFYHWDLPLALEEKGGWTERDTAKRYADYAVAMAERLSGRAARFALMNEPNVHAALGHLHGTHAPGRTGQAAYGAAVHHLNLAQALAAAPVREAGRVDVGTVVAWNPAVPRNEDSAADREAAALVQAMFHEAALTPLLSGVYPDGLPDALTTPFRTEGDLDGVRLDFVGVNTYARSFVSARSGGMPDVSMHRNGPASAMGWETSEAGLRLALEQVAALFGGPLYVTENGIALDDAWDGAARVVEDGARVEFLERALSVCSDALAAGVDLRGYLAWTLMDNFEWAEGYRPRFGLLYTDYETQTRVPKRSWLRFQQIIERRSLS